MNPKAVGEVKDVAISHRHDDGEVTTCDKTTLAFNNACHSRRFGFSHGAYVYFSRRLKGLFFRILPREQNLRRGWRSSGGRTQAA